MSTSANAAIPSAEEVLYEAADGVAIIRFNRPTRGNAWTPPLGVQYHDQLERAANDPAVRVIIVTGEGKAFCVGADMDALQGKMGNLGGMKPDSRPHTFPLSIPKPVIAAINGPAAGLGLVLALMCDMRFAAPGIKLTTSFVRRGLIAEYGAAWILPRLIGPSKAKDLLLSGRVVMTEEAHEIGLVDRLCGPGKVLEDARTYALDLVANCSPASMAAIKQQVNDALETDLPTAVEVATQRMMESFGKPDMAEGVMSYLQKRPPNFPPLKLPEGQSRDR